MTTHIRSKLAAGAAACLLATGAIAQHAGKGHSKDDDDPAASSSVAVDSRGRLRALTAEEAQALVAGIARYVDQSSAGLTMTRLPSGATAIDLDDRFQSVSLARVSTDGRVVMQCVDTKAGALEFLTGNRTTRRAAPSFILEEK